MWFLRDGTPGGQMVTERFQVDWATVLVSSFSTIVIRFDGHGSGFQGTNLLHKVRQRLGELEERDQLEALRSVCFSPVINPVRANFKKNLFPLFRFISKEPYVDKTRMGVYGKVTCQPVEKKLDVSVWFDRHKPYSWFLCLVVGLRRIFSNITPEL